MVLDRHSKIAVFIVHCEGKEDVDLNILYSLTLYFINAHS